MSARKNPTRHLVKYMTDMMQTLNDPSYELPEGMTLVEVIRSELMEHKSMIFVDVRDHQLLDNADGSSWAAVDIQVTIIDAMYGDEVKMSYIGQASDSGMDAYDRAFDAALKGCLEKTFFFKPISPVHEVIVPLPLEEDAPVEVVEEETVEEAQEEAPPAPVEDLDVPEEVVDTPPAEEPVEEAPAEEVEEVTEEVVEEAVEEEQAPEEEVTEEEDVEEEEPEVAQEEVVEGTDDAPADEAPEATEEDVEEAAEEVAEDVEEDIEDVEQAPEEEATEEEPAEESADDLAQDETPEAPDVAASAEFDGFSRHPLWQEYWEVLSSEIAAHGYQKELFVDQLTKTRSVEHLFWLSPEQLQAEVDYLDQLSDPNGYFANPEREPASESERFMYALQTVTDGESAKLFRDLYLERMGAGLLTDVDEVKLRRMVQKIMSKESMERAEYIDSVLSTEA